MSGALPTVVIIDDQPLFRGALRLLYEKELACEILGDFTDPVDALPALQHRPDLIVTNLLGSTASGPGRVRWLHSHCPDAHVLICSLTVPALYSLQECLDAGASGYVSRTASPAQFVLCAREALAGRLALDRATASALIEAQQKQAALGLTPREQEVLALVSVGLSNLQIANRLHISVHTVKALVSQVLSKMHVGDRGAAASYVRENAIFPLASHSEALPVPVDQDAEPRDPALVAPNAQAPTVERESSSDPDIATPT